MKYLLLFWNTDLALFDQVTPEVTRPNHWSTFVNESQFVISQFSETNENGNEFSSSILFQWECFNYCFPIILVSLLSPEIRNTTISSFPCNVFNSFPYFHSLFVISLLVVSKLLLQMCCPFLCHVKLWTQNGCHESRVHPVQYFTNIYQIIFPCA